VLDNDQCASRQLNNRESSTSAIRIGVSGRGLRDSKVIATLRINKIQLSRTTGACDLSGGHGISIVSLAEESRQLAGYGLDRETPT
jgi:hypothetical protein